MADWRGAAVVLAGSIPYTVALTVATIRAHASQRWPRVNGVLSLSEFFVGDTDAFVSPSGRRYPSNPRSLHLFAALPMIAYDYHVEGTAYVGTRLRFGPILNLPAQHWIRAHQRGAAVSVVYDPRRPKISVLESGVSPALAFSLAIALAFVGVGLWWLIVSLRS